MEGAKTRVKETWDKEFKNMRKPRLVQLMHELVADTDILFGSGFNVTVFKDAFKLTNLNVNLPDIG